jgi:hypothetical protein
MPPLFSSFSSMYHNTDHWLLLVRRKLPYTHLFSLQIHEIGTERRAQIHLFNICKYNRSHGKNLRSTPGQAVPFAQYYFKHSTTCTWSRSNGSDYLFIYWRIFFTFFMKTSYLQGDHFTLKGPKLEIFGSRVFPQIRPVWVSDLETRQKSSKFWLFRLENRRFVLFIAVTDIAIHF